MQLTSFFAVAAVAAQAVVGLDINCRGSPACGIAFMSGAHLNDIKAIVDQVDDKRIYRNGERVACLQINTVNLVKQWNTDICLYPKNSDGNIPGSLIKSLVQQLVDQKCGICGSVPVDYGKGGHDGAKGELTINVVGSLSVPEGCKGVPCPPN